MPEFLVFMNKVVGRKLGSADFTREILYIEILHDQHFLVQVLSIHSDRVNMSPENNNSCVIIKTIIVFNGVNLSS